MSKRKVIRIDEELCDGCGLCIPNCPEGALKVIDGKARLISDLFCDGLGACIGNCPVDAITVEEREAEPYDEVKVMENIVQKGPNTIKEHLEHLLDHQETALYEQAIGYLKEHQIDIPKTKESPQAVSGCPGCEVTETGAGQDAGQPMAAPSASQLKNWPIQIMLVPENAPYFKDADLLLAADCAAFSKGGFHPQLLKGKVLMIGCPKLDDAKFYMEKLSNILKSNDVRSVTVAYMEVPCCFGMVSIAKEAVKASGKDIPLQPVKISIQGETLS